MAYHAGPLARPAWSALANPEGNVIGGTAEWQATGVSCGGTRYRGRVTSAERSRAHVGSIGKAPVPARLVVLVSGTGTNLQALLDATIDPAYGAAVVAVGADRPGTLAEQRARDAEITTFCLPLKHFDSREDWDRALTAAVAEHRPDLVVSAGFLSWSARTSCSGSGVASSTPTTRCCPSFPGIHGPRDALAYGVKVAGATLFVVDEGVDTGAIVAQVAVPVEDDDDEDSLHGRIKPAERAMLVEHVGRMAREGFTVDRQTRADRGGCRVS